MTEDKVEHLFTGGASVGIDRDVLSCKRAEDAEGRMQSGTEIDLDCWIAGNRTELSSDISPLSTSRPCVVLVAQLR